MNAQYPSEFERPKRKGDVLIQWRNKQCKLIKEKIDRRWHKYKWMSQTEANDFMRECAPNSSFFEYRIFKQLDTKAEIGHKGAGSL